jgi:hypothetical protein
MIMKNIAKVLWMTLILGCSINNNALAGPNEQLGTVIGGVAGGILGNNLGHGSGKTATTIGGAVIGSMVGNQIGMDADASERYRRHHQYTQWNAHHRPLNVYPPQPHYRHTFIGPNGRLCRRSMLTNAEGDTIYVTYCCYHMLRNGFCDRWIRVD